MLKKIRQKIQRNKNFERNTNIYSKMEGAIERERERIRGRVRGEKKKMRCVYLAAAHDISTKLFTVVFVWHSSYALHYRAQIFKQQIPKQKQ